MPRCWVSFFTCDVLNATRKGQQMCSERRWLRGTRLQVKLIRAVGMIDDEFGTGCACSVVVRVVCQYAGGAAMGRDGWWACHVYSQIALLGSSCNPRQRTCMTTYYSRSSTAEHLLPECNVSGMLWNKTPPYIARVKTSGTVQPP